MPLNMILLSFIPLYICFIIFVGLMMFTRRFKAVKSKTVKISVFKSNQELGTEDLAVIKNSYSNQFEVPILFFVTVLASVILNATRLTTIVLAVLFVLSRVLHFYVHVGTNNVRHRAVFFFSGFILILLMWLQIMITANVSFESL